MLSPSLGYIIIHGTSGTEDSSYMSLYPKCFKTGRSRLYPLNWRITSVSSEAFTSFRMLHLINHIHSARRVMTYQV